MVTRTIGTKLLKRNVDKVRGGFLYKLGTQLLIDKKFPLLIYLELTRNCNYHCPMCSRMENPIDGYLSEAIIEKIVNEAKQYGSTAFCLHLFGEPLLNPQWYKAVEIIKKAREDNVVILTTNGSLMNYDNSKRIINLGVDIIYVSIHSLDTETYNLYTGGELDVVLKNVREFTLLNTKTRLIVRLFNSDHKDKLEVWNIPFEIKKYHNFAGSRGLWSEMWGKRKRYPCFHPWFTLAVAVDGSVHICCGDSQHRMIIGNAFQQTIKEIWKSKQVKEIRKMHIKNQFDNTPCLDCDQWQYRPNIFLGNSGC